MKIKSKQVWNIFYNTVFVLLVIIAGIIVISTINFPGNIKFFSVQSGSMEPAIHVGSVVIVKPMDSYQTGDVITVTEPSNSQITVSHRIITVNVNNGQTSYVTKGDANNAADSEERPAKNVLGKVVFSIPVLGYLVTYAKTREGLLLLVIIPTIIIILSELWSIKSETQKLLEERRKRNLTLTEKIEVDIGEEEIKAENWYRKFTKNIGSFIKDKFSFLKRNKTK